MSLATRCGIKIEDMKQMSYVSLINILVSAVGGTEEEKQASQEDIDTFFG